jgi:Flp pilus assembly protein CpaB
VAAAVSAILAAAVLLVFLNQYRNSLDGQRELTTVLVAKNLIEKGSSGTIIAEQSVFQTERVKKSELKAGAISDPANLRGKVASDDIYPGEQFVIGDFAPATGGVRERITGKERAISLPLDNAHGMIGDVQTGDHVDIYVVLGAGGTGIGQSRAILKTLVQDALVLRAPKAAKASSAAATGAQQVVVRVSDRQAPKLAYAADTGKVWLVLRSKIGVRQSKPALVDQRTLLLDPGPDGRPTGGSR